MGGRAAHPTVRAVLAGVLLAAQVATAQPSAVQPGAPAAQQDTPAPAPVQASAPAPSPAPAQPAPQATYQPPAAPAAGGLLQTLLALCFVLALLAGLAWLAKRFGPRAMGGTANLRIVGALSLGGRERILVVEVADQWIVVGASPGRVNVLSTMPRQELPPAPPGMAASMPAGFGDWLKQTLEKRNAK